MMQRPLLWIRQTLPPFPHPPHFPSPCPPPLPSTPHVSLYRCSSHHHHSLLRTTDLRLSPPSLPFPPPHCVREEDVLHVTSCTPAHPLLLSLSTTPLPFIHFSQHHRPPPPRGGLLPLPTSHQHRRIQKKGATKKRETPPFFKHNPSPFLSQRGERGKGGEDRSLLFFFFPLCLGQFAQPPAPSSSPLFFVRPRERDETRAAPPPWVTASTASM